MSKKVARLRESSTEKAEVLQILQQAKDEEGAAAMEVRELLEAVEDELIFLRAEAERAAILQQQFDLQQLMIEDLRMLREREVCSSLKI